MPEFTVRPMKRPELDLALNWAAKEGWNPGLHDAEAFWNADSEGFFVAMHNSEVIGTVSIISYDCRFGFIGLLILRPDYRKRGWGREFWNEALRMIRDRLQPGVAIGLDGVLAMQPFYEKSGFQLGTKNLRFQGTGVAGPLPNGLLPAARVPFDDLVVCDAAHFPGPRSRFLTHWLKMPDSAAFAARGPMKLAGYALVRKCQTGFKIGPLFARNDSTAEDLFKACSNHAAGQPLFLDVPESNAPAMALAARHNMKQVSSTVRMFNGVLPKFNAAGVYGFTTPELG
jgi:GNAT superfamily N-acetyltransferase